MVAEYEVWLDRVRDALHSINMQMEDWQRMWPFNFSAEYKAGRSPDATAMKANRFGGASRIGLSRRSASRCRTVWLPRGHQGECQPVSSERTKASYECGDYVKVEFPGEAGMPSEWMWVRVHHRDDEKQLVFGTLDNEPLDDHGGKLELGSELAVSYSQIREHRKPTEFTKQ